MTNNKPTYEELESKIAELEKEVEILKNERHEFQKDSRQDKG